jgi:hypothetical protein
MGRIRIDAGLAMAISGVVDWVKRNPIYSLIGAAGT